MKQYLDLLDRTLKEGKLKHNRTGVDTLSISGSMLEFDMSTGKFPLLTTKKMGLKTVFSDGSIENIGNRAVSIYSYDHDVLVRSIYVSDSGQISINHRICRMKNAKQFLEQLKSILED